MALADWQRGLATLLTAPDPGTPLPTGLSPREHAWLTRTTRDPGLRVTRDVQRAWRRTRLGAALPLTMAALPVDARPGLVAAYLDACPCVSFFHVHEGRMFFRFLAARTPPLAHIHSLAALEVAMHDAGEWLVFAEAPAAPLACPDDARLVLHPGATRVRFDAAPELVIGSVLAGCELPPDDGGRHEMIVASGVRHFGRALTGAETELLDLCAAGTTLAELATRIPDGRALATHLLDERALVPDLDRTRASDGSRSNPI